MTVSTRLGPWTWSVRHIGSRLVARVLTAADAEGAGGDGDDGSAERWTGSLLGRAIAIGWSDMPAWLAWLVAAAVLGVAELVTLAFAAGLMAAAAVVAAVVAGAGGGPAAQAVAFAGASFAALGVVYPLASRRRNAHTSYRSGVDALPDRPAVALSQVDAYAGTVRIGGEVWSARAYDRTQVIAAGTPVHVFEIEGATALVYPREPS